MTGRTARLVLLLSCAAAVGSVIYVRSSTERSHAGGGLASSASLDARDPDALRARRIRERLEPARRDFERTVEELRRTQGDGHPLALVAARDRLAARLQAELGPSDYDWALYLHELSNCVVIESTPFGLAEAAGLEPGDVLFRYAGQRIFTRDDLRRAGARVAAGARVEVSVARGARRVDLKLPAGSLEALGFGLETRLERPDHAS